VGICLPAVSPVGCLLQQKLKINLFNLQSIKMSGQPSAEARSNDDPPNEPNDRASDPVPDAEHTDGSNSTELKLKKLYRALLNILNKHGIEHSSGVNLEPVEMRGKNTEEDEALAKLVYEAVRNKFASLYPNLPGGKMSKHSELAAIVAQIKDENGPTRIEVLSIGTGTKWISTDQLLHEFDNTPRGEYLLDNHAEVIAVRSFRKFLYSQLNDESEILERSQDSGKFRKKSIVKLILITTSPPCGNARLKQLVRITKNT